MRRLAGFIAIFGALALPATAAAATHEVGANGNVATGGLSFTPAQIDAGLGDIVRWTNTDFFVPHTATEVNRLWDLTGTYGGTPANPPGFGPGEARERIFEAGSFAYICDVHPVEMTGVIAVTPEVERLRIGKRSRLRVDWAVAPPVAGQVFDVQRRIDGDWKKRLDGTAKPAATFRGRRGAFRARLRFAADPVKASGWSPVAAAR